jgi:hypothetical protein
MRTLVALILALAGSAFYLRADVVVDVTVDGTTMPWLSNATLNTADSFGDQDGGDPTVVNASSGISFAPGSMLTITYLSGLTNPIGGKSPKFDGIGDTNYTANNNDGTSGKPFPSFFMDSATYPIYLNALVGTFANSAGDIVGTPFAVDDGPFLIAVPTGATQLQLGVNDDIFSDNSGSLDVSVQGPATVPEPAAYPVLGAALGLALLAIRKQRRSRA